MGLDGWLCVCGWVGACCLCRSIQHILPHVASRKGMMLKAPAWRAMLRDA